MKSATKAFANSCSGLMTGFGILYQSTPPGKRGLFVFQVDFFFVSSPGFFLGLGVLTLGGGSQKEPYLDSEKNFPHAFRALANHPFWPKWGVILGSTSFPPVIAVARKFFRTADQGHWEHREQNVCTFFAEQKKII